MENDTVRTLMRCSISRHNIATFANAIVCLSKIGKDAVIEASKNKDGRAFLTLRSLNDSKTSFAIFTFNDSFFDVIAFNSKSNTTLRQVTGKLLLKSCLSVFKTVRSVEFCEISFVQHTTWHIIIFTLKSKHNLVKTYKFHYEETELLDATFDESNIENNVLTASADFFMQPLQHIYYDEIIVTAKEHDLAISSSYQFSSTNLEQLKTSITLNGEDFDTFKVKNHNFQCTYEEDNDDFEIEFSFGVKEFKAILEFNGNDNVSMIFTQPGLPLLLTSELKYSNQTSSQASQDENNSNQQPFKSELILATIDPRSRAVPTQRRRTEANPAKHGSMSARMTHVNRFNTASEPEPVQDEEEEYQPAELCSDSKYQSPGSNSNKDDDFSTNQQAAVSSSSNSYDASQQPASFKSRSGSLDVNQMAAAVTTFSSSNDHQYFSPATSSPVVYNTQSAKVNSKRKSVLFNQGQEIDESPIFKQKKNIS